jgi:hypothetical protein
MTSVPPAPHLQPVLAGPRHDGGGVADIWIDRLALLGVGETTNLISLLGNEATAITVGSPKGRHVPQAAADCPFAYFGPLRESQHHMDMRSARGQASPPGAADSKHSTREHYIVVAFHTSMIIGVPLSYANEVVRGLVTAGMTIHRDGSESCVHLVVGNVSNSTVGQVVQGLVNARVPPDLIVYHRFGRICTLPTTEARAHDTGWFSDNHHRVFDQGRFAENPFLIAFSAILNTGKFCRYDL